MKEVPFAWARLNADTMFIGTLAIGVGMFALFNPLDDPVVAIRAAAGNGVELYPLHYIRSAANVVGGLLILVALARSSVTIEVLGRAVIMGALLLNVYRHVSWLGLFDNDTLEQLLWLTLFAIASTLRLSVLLGDRNKAVVISRPPINGEGGAS